MSQLRVWGIGTTRTLRVHWMAHELGIDYVTVPVQSRSGETQQAQYRELNAKEKIPVLEHDGLVISESYAILRYLRTLSDSLVPDAFQASALGRIRYDEWVSFILMELDATSLYVIRRHGGLPHIYGESEAAVASSRDYFVKMLEAVTDRIPAEGFLWGDTFSELDVLMAVNLWWAQQLQIPLSAIALNYLKSMQQRPAWRLAYEHNFP